MRILLSKNIMQNIIEIIKKITDKTSNIYNEFQHNNLISFFNWIITKLELCFVRKNNKIQISKWEIFYANMGYGVWNEIFKKRPIVVISEKFANLGDMVLVAPFTTAKDDLWINKEKNKRYFLYIPKSRTNGLDNDSFVSISQIRYISKKRLDRKIWQLELDLLQKTIRKVWKIIWIKKSHPIKSEI